MAFQRQCYFERIVSLRVENLPSLNSAFFENLPYPYSGKDMKTEQEGSLAYLGRYVKNIFERYGDIGDIYFPTEKGTGRFLGYGFVSYYNKRHAEDALHGLNGRKVGGRELRIKIPSASLRVDNIPNGVRRHVLEEDLKTLFERYGDIDNVDLHLTGFRGYAFVKYYSKRDAGDALHELNGHKYNGSELRIKMYKASRHVRSDGRDWYSWERSSFRDERKSRFRSCDRRKERRSFSEESKSRSRSCYRRKERSRSASGGRGHVRSGSKDRSRSRFRS